MRLLSSPLFVLFLSSLTADAAALVPVPTPPPRSAPVAGLEVNKGQASPGILFSVPGFGGDVAVTAQSVLYSPDGAALTLVASNPNPTVSFSDPLPGLANSYTGSDPTKWITGIPRYATASLASVYSGINAQYTIDSNGTLTLNLWLAAGVDPKTITFQIAQASQLVVYPDGSLIARIGQGVGFEMGPSLSYAPPAVSQSTSSGSALRTANFLVQSATTFGFDVQGIDPTLPVEISLALAKASSSPVYFTGTNGAATDAAGNNYVTLILPDAARNVQGLNSENCGVEIGQPIACLDVAVYKFSAAGTLDFVTYLRGQFNESAGFLGLAPSGALIVAGSTNSSDFPTSPSAAQPAYGGGGGDIFVSLLDANTGALQASTFLGGANVDSLGDAAIGPDSSIYLLPAGQFFSAGMPVTDGALLSSCQESPCTNGYAAHLSPALDKLIYGTYLPGKLQAAAQLYSDGSIYYAGTAQAGFPTTPGAYQPQNAGGYDGFIARLDPTGSKLLFGTYFGGPNTDWITTVSVAPDGSVWAGVTSFVQCCTNVNYQLIHLDSNGAKLLANQPIEVDDMVVSPAGNLFALARGTFATSPGALMPAPCDSFQLAYVELSPTGQQLFATYLPLDVIGFDGADSQGTPYLDTFPRQRAQVVQNQPTGAFAGCLVDAAAFGNANTVSPGGIVSIFGTGLGPKQGVGFQLTNGQLPTTLGGTQVLVNGEPAPLLYVSDSQLNVIMPFSLVGGTVPAVQVASSAVQANPIYPSVVYQDITIFRVNNSAAALNQDGTLNSPNNPAKPGSTIALFGTGGGQTNPPSTAGDITPSSLLPLPIPPQAQIPGTPPTPLTVQWAGAAPDLLSGVIQINITLPDKPPVVAGYPKGTLPIQVQSSGGLNSDLVTIYVAAN